MRTLILLMWSILAPGADRLPSAIPVADAIAAVAGDEQTAALLSVYAWRESSLQPHVVGDGGRSCGVWQMACSRIQGLSLTQQAALWLSDVRASSLAAVDSSPSRAARRTDFAMKLLDRAKGVR